MNSYPLFIIAYNKNFHRSNALINIKYQYATLCYYANMRMDTHYNVPIGRYPHTNTVALYKKNRRLYRKF